MHKVEGNTIHHWKHGIPTDDYKALDERVIDIFIFRRLNDWLISMFYNHHHLKKKWDTFEEFLRTTHTSSEDKEIDNINNNPVNLDDNNKTIFGIREYKFNKIIEYKERNKDVIFVNLSYLQTEEDLLHFLSILDRKYLNRFNQTYTLSIPHTKSEWPNLKHKSLVWRNSKNRTYDINASDCMDIINSCKNADVENFIDKLTFIIK